MLGHPLSRDEREMESAGLAHSMQPDAGSRLCPEFWAWFNSEVTRVTSVGHGLRAVPPGLERHGGQNIGLERHGGQNIGLERHGGQNIGLERHGGRSLQNRAAKVSPGLEPCRILFRGAIFVIPGSEKHWEEVQIGYARYNDNGGARQALPSPLYSCTR